MSLSEDQVRAYARALLDEGATPELIEHAMSEPRLLRSTIEAYQRDLARIVGTTRRHYYPLFDDLRLDRKIANPLEAAGITTALQLCACDRRGLMSLRLVGSESVERITAALEHFGLRLRDDEEPYTRRLLELTTNVRHTPVSLLHMQKPREWFGLQHSYKYLHVETIGELIRHSENRLRTAAYISGGARVGLFNPFTVTDIVTTLRELGLTLKKE